MESCTAASRWSGPKRWCSAANPGIQVLVRVPVPILLALLFTEVTQSVCCAASMVRTQCMRRFEVMKDVVMNSHEAAHKQGKSFIPAECPPRMQDKSPLASARSPRWGRNPTSPQMFFRASHNRGSIRSDKNSCVLCLFDDRSTPGSQTPIIG